MQHPAQLPHWAGLCAPVNAASFGSGTLFGHITANGASATTPATTTATSAGSTSKLGYQNPPRAAAGASTAA